MAPPPSLVDETAQRAEKLRHAMNFIENDKPVLILAQKESRFREFTPVFTRFQVKVKRRDGLAPIFDTTS